MRSTTHRTVILGTIALGLALFACADTGRDRTEAEPSAQGAGLGQPAEPVSAVAPGQSAVFYDGETVVGGGVIESAA